MPTTIYRADSRPAADINTADGFSARQAGYDLDGARNVAQRLMDPTHTLTLPDGAAPGLFKAIEDSPTGRVSLLDMVRVAKAEKSINTIHVSTDYTDACGGYADAADGKGNRNLTYRMEVPDGHYVHFKQNGNGSFPDAPTANSTHIAGPDTGTTRPVLIMDNANPQLATFIAIASHGNELTFLTPVPLTWVQEYRTQDKSAPGGYSPWTPMPAPVAAVGDPAATAPAVPAIAAVVPPATAAIVTPPTPPTTAAAEPAVLAAPSDDRFAHPYHDPDHQLHGKYTDAVNALKVLPENRFNDTPQKVEHSAVGLVHASERARIDQIDHAAVNGSSLFVIKGEPTSASSQRAFVQSNDFNQAPVAMRAPEPVMDAADATLGRGGPKIG